MAPTQLVQNMSAQELRAELQQHGVKTGPITDSTRHIYEKKLERARNPGKTPRGANKSPSRAQQGINASAISSKGRRSPSIGGSPIKRISTEQSTSANVSMNSARGVVRKRTLTPPRAAPRKQRVTSAQPQNSHPSKLAVDRSPVLDNETDGWTMGEEHKSDHNERERESSWVFLKRFQPALNSSTSKSSSISSPAFRYPTNTYNGNGGSSHYYFRHNSRPFPSTEWRVGDNGSDGGSEGRSYFSSKLNNTREFFSRQAGQAAMYSAGPFNFSKHSTARYGKVNRPSVAKQYPAATTTSGSFFDLSGWILFFLTLFTLGIAIAYVHHSSPNFIGAAFTRFHGGVNEAAHLLYSYAIRPAMTAVLLGIGILCAIGLWKWLLQAREEHKRQLMELVERIIDEIRNAQQRGGIAETHVRDILMPLTRRTDKDWQLWGEASHFINTKDSRVRTEVRLINGVEFNFWCWAAPNSPSSPIGSSREAH